jgi:hypothetical protein
VAKLSPDGASFVYSGCLGGSGAPNYPSAIAVDNAGNAYVTGFTQAGDFPLMNPVQTTHPAGIGFVERFVFKLGPNGTMVYSTFLGAGRISLAQSRSTQRATPTLLDSPRPRISH